ncbi:YadA-like C-terminal region [Stutzerimonas stutzeri]|nr:YadA-like C-terminal region [Stutzerimonas stutzeri]
MSQASQALNATNAGWELTTNATGTGIASGSSVVNVNATNKLVTFTAGDNIEITQSGRNVTMALARNINVNSVTTNDLTVSGTTNLSGTTNISGTMNVQANTTVNMGGNRIQNVGNATAPTDAVNKAYVDNALRNSGAVPGLANRVNQLARDLNKVDKNARAGIAGAMAASGLYQATQPGKSMVSAGAATYRGQNAVAVGYSRLSDNGKVGIKFSVNTNTQGDTGAAASVGYQW